MGGKILLKALSELEKRFATFAVGVDCKTVVFSSQFTQSAISIILACVHKPHTSIGHRCEAKNDCQLFIQQIHFD